MGLLKTIGVNEELNRPPDLLVLPFSGREGLLSDYIEGVALKKLHRAYVYPHLINIPGDSRQHFVDNWGTKVLNDGFKFLDSAPQENFLPGGLVFFTM